MTRQKSCKVRTKLNLEKEEKHGILPAPVLVLKFASTVAEQEVVADENATFSSAAAAAVVVAAAVSVAEVKVCSS